jgi:hypothetical protein
MLIWQICCRRKPLQRRQSPDFHADSNHSRDVAGELIFDGSANDGFGDEQVTKQLPDILTSAGFWASIATLWSASGAWFTFVGAVRSSRQQTYEGVRNLILGIEVELALVEQWASGKEGEIGYLKSEDGTEGLANAHPEKVPWNHLTTCQMPFSVQIRCDHEQNPILAR